MADLVGGAAVDETSSIADVIELRLSELRAGKVEVQVKPIGNAPAARQPRFTIDGSKRFCDLVTYLKKSLNLEILHVYCCDAFEPMQDESIADLKRCFGVGGRLTLSYSREAAFS
mmetsp:Transcript_32034/g.92578  ORF Transcript_32034/g.92578 Transcript_32034/m.92578 type:complete len:115 (+) Transcript_32034:81-425(+)